MRFSLGERAGIFVERTRQLLRILLHLLHQRLQEFVHRGAKIIHQFFQFFVGGAAFERLPQGFLSLAQRLFGLADIAVFDLNRHVPHPRRRLAQRVVGFGIGQVEIEYERKPR